MDALRSRIKYLDPPVRVTDTWEQVRPRVERYDEYQAIESDSLRQAAFDKVIRRLREKEDDIDNREQGRHHHDRDRDHRRDALAPSSRRSRSPEPDAYEADRRKAQADRERSYRRTGASSPIRERRDDRHRDPDYRRDRHHPPSHYELERRDREGERERLYRTRAEPRGSRDELDYGADTQSTAGATERRRRHDSDADSSSMTGRAPKRHRHDSPEREHRRGPPENKDEDAVVTPAEYEAQKEEKAVHSGSEEGEIEEED